MTKAAKSSSTKKSTKKATKADKLAQDLVQPTMLEKYGPAAFTLAVLAGLGALAGYFSKTSIKDVDRAIPVDLSNQDYNIAKQLIDQKNSESFVDRNATWMGALSLGISSLFQNGSSNVEETVYELRRNSKDLVKKWDAQDKICHSRRVDLQELEIQNRKSEGHEQMTRTAANTATAITRALASN